jgi:hypothetical protein
MIRFKQKNIDIGSPNKLIKYNWTNAGIQQSFLLDTYPGATAAYSLRKLRLGYTGNAIRVRRASDNTEQDIGFDGVGGLDLTTLTTFCTGTNGLITTWYDQSTNGYNSVSTSASNQPQIVSSGMVLTENGFPCIQFDGINDFLDNNQVPLPFGGIDSYFSGFMIGKSTDTVNASRVFLAMGFTFSNNPFLIISTGAPGVNQLSTNVRDNSLAANNLNSGSIGSQTLLTFITNGDISTCSTNGTVVGSNTASLGDRTYNRFSIGSLNRASRSNYWLGNIQEIVLYQSNQTTIKSNIETDINSYYSIYP